MLTIVQIITIILILLKGFNFITWSWFVIFIPMAIMIFLLGISYLLFIMSYSDWRIGHKAYDSLIKLSRSGKGQEEIQKMLTGYFDEDNIAKIPNYYKRFLHLDFKNSIVVWEKKKSKNISYDIYVERHTDEENENTDFFVKLYTEDGKLMTHAIPCNITPTDFFKETEYKRFKRV